MLVFFFFLKHIHIKKASCESQFQMKSILFSSYEIRIFLWEVGSWEIYIFSFLPWFPLRYSMRYAPLLLVSILRFDQINSCIWPSHWEVAPKRDLSSHPFPTQGQAGHVGPIKGRNPLERIPGSLPSNSLVSSPFRVPFLHLCAFVQVFVFQSIFKKKK